MEPGKNQKPEPTHASARDDDAELLSLSAEYSASLSIGNKPDLEALLAQVAPDRQASLMRHFQSLANVYANSDKSEPTDSSRLQSDSATGGGPRTIADAKSQELIDSASMTQTRDVTVAHLAASEPVQHLGDYDLLGELGRGGMGVVYRARHRERGDIVALKILPHVDGESLHRFKREFRSLADISHPNLVGLRSLENEGQQWFFTMDLVENACNFRRFVRPNNELNVGRLKSSVLQLCEGLRKLHELDIIHRDLKPSNVVVDANGRVVILDFGLVSEVGRNEQTLTVASVSGTPAYMSPEAAGGEAESIASDWYSVGVILYQALSGGLPFEGDTLHLLNDKRSKDAPELSANHSNESELARICMRLLDREPSNRPTYEDVKGAFGGTRSDTKSQGVVSDQLLGREWHLAQLRGSFQSVLHSERASIVFVGGKSGEGKSALIERFLAELRETQEVVVLSGRCYDRESVPFKALDGLIDALVSHLRRLEPQKVSYLLPDDTGFLARVFPVLMRVEAIAERPRPDLSGLDEQQIRNRSFLALKELLRRLAGNTPIILACDDLQWGDNDSAQVLMDVLSGSAVPKLLFIGSFRSDEADNSPFLESWREHFHDRDRPVPESSVDVSPLKLSECQSLFQRRFPAVSGTRACSFAEDIFNATGGNAFFVSEMLDSLQVDGNEISHLPLSQVLAEKLAGLPPEASEVLNTVAVSGRSIETEELLRTAGKSDTSFSTLNSLRNLRLLRFIDEHESGRIDTYHDKIREAVLEALGENGRAPYHLRLAKEIESQSGAIDDATIELMLSGRDVSHPDIARVYDLAFHFNASGNREQGILYSFLAAEQARRQFSPEVAITHYRVAQPETQGGILTALEARLVEGLAESLHRLGRYTDAQDVLDSLTKMPEDTLQRARIHYVACLVAGCRNEFGRALEQANSGLRLLGTHVPSTGFGLTLRTAGLLIRHAMRGGKWKHGGQSPTAKETLFLEFIEHASCFAAFSNGKWLVWYLLTGLETTRRVAANTASSRVFAGYSVGASVAGFQSHAESYANQAREISERLDDTYSEAITRTWTGVSDFASADFSRATDNFAAACKLFSRAGGRFYANLAMFHLGLANTHRGEFEQGMLQLCDAFLNSASVGDMRTNCSLYGLTRVSEGAIDVDKLMQHVVRSDEDILSTCNLDKVVGIQLAEAGNYEEAIERFQRSLRRPRKHIVPNFHVVAGLPYLARTLRLYADKLQDIDATKALKMRKRACRVALRGIRLSWFFPSENSFALREYGAALADLAKYKKAEKYLKKSCRISEKHNTPFELAKSRLALAELDAKRGKAGAEGELEKARTKVGEYRQQIANALKKVEARLDRRLVQEHVSR